MDAAVQNQFCRELKAEAVRLGFSLFGITAAIPAPDVDTYRQWIERGGHADMTYLARPDAVEKRTHPGMLLPGVQSMIVLGMDYPAPPSLEPLNPSGQIAAYAQQPDYHTVIPPHLEALAEWLQTRLGRSINWRSATDSTPILERSYARQAGLGWIGKNSCLIAPGKGSYFVLAELLVDVELPLTDAFTHDGCGKCTRCMDACPTGCIRTDRTLDAGRCISYLTIENKGAVPAELRPRLGSWVFGCDVCQRVCPWNRFAPPTNPVDSLKADLLQDLALSTEAFKRKFHHNPILRAKRQGYLRNIAVVLGNQHQPDSLPALISALQTEAEALVRRHIVWALGQFNHPAARAALLAALDSESDDSVRKEIKSAITP